MRLLFLYWDKDNFVPIDNIYVEGGNGTTITFGRHTRPFKGSVDDAKRSIQEGNTDISLAFDCWCDAWWWPWFQKRLKTACKQEDFRYLRLAAFTYGFYCNTNTDALWEVAPWVFDWWDKEQYPIAREAFIDTVNGSRLFDDISMPEGRMFPPNEFALETLSAAHKECYAEYLTDMKSDQDKFVHDFNTKINLFS